MLAERAMEEKGIKILCARVLKESAESGLIGAFWEEINKLGYQKYFQLFSDKIVCVNGSEIHFKGTNCNPEELKSFNQYKYLWLEEAENISERAFETIKTSIRGEDREIFVSWNPYSKNSAVWIHFMDEYYFKTEKEQTEIDNLLLKQKGHNYDFFYMVIRQNITDLFESEKKYSAVLGQDVSFVPADMRAEYERDLMVWGWDSSKFQNKWMGEPFDADCRYPFYGKYKVIDELPYSFEIKDGAVFFDGNKVQLLGGQDYGYTVDPNALNILFEHRYQQNLEGIITGKKDLYIIDEVHTPQRCQAETIHELTMQVCPYIIPTRTPIDADTSHQMITDKLKFKYNWNIGNVSKPKKIKGSGKNFIRAGIDFILEYDNIYILSKCKHTIEELKLFSVLMDKKTGKLSDDEFEDENNHHIDAIRYALNKLILKSAKMMYYDSADNYIQDGNNFIPLVQLKRKKGYNANSAVQAYTRQLKMRH